MTCLLLPGLDGTGALHGPFVDALGLGCTVLSYPADMSSYDDLRDWVAARLPAEPFLLIAESFSGPLALQLAALRPDGLKGLVCVASFAHAPRPAPAFMASALRIMPVKSRLASQMMQPAVMGRWASRAFTAQLWQALKTVPAATLAARLEQVLRADARDELAALDLPMMYLRPRQDRLVPKSAVHPFAQVGAQVAQCDGPHFILQAQPAQSAALVRSFAAALGLASDGSAD